MGLLTVTVSAMEPCVLVSVTGEADTTVSGQLGEPLAAALLAGARQLVVDVSGLRFIDAECVRVLVGVREAAEHAGGALRLVAPQPVVARMLELCCAEQLVAVHGSLPQVASHQMRPAKEAAAPDLCRNHKYPADADRRAASRAVRSRRRSPCWCRCAVNSAAGCIDPRDAGPERERGHSS